MPFNKAQQKRCLRGVKLLVYWPGETRRVRGENTLSFLSPSAMGGTGEASERLSSRLRFFDARVKRAAIKLGDVGNLLCWKPIKGTRSQQEAAARRQQGGRGEEEEDRVG